MHYVYFLICKDNHSYIGCTNNLRNRISRHQKGCVKATKERLPVVLSTYFAFNNKHTAFEFEKYLKTHSGREFIKRHQLFTSA